MLNALGIAPALLFLAPAVVQDGPAAEPVARRVPAGTLIHAEIPSCAELGAAWGQTDLMALLHDEEFRTFLNPGWNGLKSDLEFLLAEEEGLFDLLVSEPPGRMTFSLEKLELPEEEEPDWAILMTVELPERIEPIFDRVREIMEEEGGRKFAEREVAGHTVLAVEMDSNGYELAAAREGDRLLVGMGREYFEDYFERTPGGLADEADYQAVLTALEVRPDSVFAYVDYQAFVKRIGESMLQGLGGLYPQEGAAEALERAMSESPTTKATRAVGYSLRGEGSDLVDRIFVYAPGKLDAFGKSGAVEQVPSAHAALLPKETDVLLTNWLDLDDYLGRMRAEEERMAELYEELELDPEVMDNGLSISSLLEKIEESTGIDLEERLVPAMGHHISFAISWPASFSLASLPEITLILDVKDPGAIDTLLDELVAQDEDIAEIEFEVREHGEGGEHRLVVATLLNAGLPALPTLCRVQDRLVATLRPGALERILELEAADSLAEDPRFTREREALEGNVDMALWTDLGATFEFLYSVTGTALNAMRSMGGQMLGGRWDPSLLPSSESIAFYLGEGYFVRSRTDDGLLMVGRSSLGNPLVGLVGGAVGTILFVATTEGVRSEAIDKRKDHAKEDMQAIGQAMLAYRDTVGGGSFPTDLAKLVDRGFLTDAAKLLDPEDPSPKRVRTGTGGRIPISYAIGRVESLPEKVQARVEGSSYFVYTRGAWHERNGKKGRLIYPLEAKRDWVQFVPEDAWNK